MVDDEAVLDEFLDRALRARAEGSAFDLAEDLARHPHLELRFQELLCLAGIVAVVRPELPPVVRGHEILGELGRGASGIVFLARQEKLQRLVALKILAPHHLASSAARARFHHEARTIASIHHPNIVLIHDVIDQPAMSAYSMEWVDGHTLEELVVRDASSLPDSRSSLAFYCKTLSAIARAVDRVHAAELIHRDIKPSNILVHRDGTPKLSDFGLVLDPNFTMGTHSGVFLGTVSFAAPEQLENAVSGTPRDLDARADIYSLGATLFHALTRRPPSLKREPVAILEDIGQGMPLLRHFRPDLPRELEAILDMAMDRRPDRRYASAAQFADDLDRFLSFERVRAKTIPLTRNVWRRVRRHRRWLVMGAVLFLVAALLTAAVARMLWKQEERRRAIPVRVAEHWRLARMALLDRNAGERAYVHIHRVDGYPAEPNTADLVLALEHYDRALSLRPDAAIAAERNLVDAIRTGKGSGSTNGGPFLRGLRAYLRSDTGTCIEAWSPLGLTRNPFVDAALGQVFLHQDQPSRAIVRLMEGAKSYPDCGFLLVDLADAAMQVDEVDFALEQLVRARELGNLLPWGADVRVEACCYAKRGEVQRARELFEYVMRNHQAPNSRRHYAAWLSRWGDHDHAATVMWESWFMSSKSPPFVKELKRIYLRWWDAKDQVERLRVIERLFAGDRMLSRQLKTVLDYLLKKEETPTLDPPNTSEERNRSSLERQEWLLPMTEHLLSRRVALTPEGASMLARLASWLMRLSTDRGSTRIFVAVLFGLAHHLYDVRLARTSMSLGFEFEEPSTFPHDAALVTSDFNGEGSEENFSVLGAHAGAPGRFQIQTIGYPGARACIMSGDLHDPTRTTKYTSFRFNPQVPVDFSMRLRVQELPRAFLETIVANGHTKATLRIESPNRILLNRVCMVAPFDILDGEFHVYRLRLDSSLGIQLILDGAVFVEIVGDPSSSNGWSIGDGGGISDGDNVCAEWDYVRFRNELSPVGLPDRECITVSLLSADGTERLATSSASRGSGWVLREGVIRPALRVIDGPLVVSVLRVPGAYASPEQLEGLALDPWLVNPSTGHGSQVSLFPLPVMSCMSSFSCRAASLNAESADIRISQTIRL